MDLTSLNDPLISTTTLDQPPCPTSSSGILQHQGGHFVFVYNDDCSYRVVWGFTIHAREIEKVCVTN